MYLSEGSWSVAQFGVRGPILYQKGHYRTIEAIAKKATLVMEGYKRSSRKATKPEGVKVDAEHTLPPVREASDTVAILLQGELMLKYIRSSEQVASRSSSFASSPSLNL